MEGLSRWDLVLWFVVAYVAVMVLIRMMLHHRGVVVRRLRDQLAVQRRKPAGPSVDEPTDAV